MTAGAFRGYNQEGRSRTPKGPIAQRQLVKTLREIIDLCRVKGASRTRDEARETLRQILGATNWQTPYVMKNLGAKRCRYIASLGHEVPIQYSMAGNIPALEQWKERRG